MHTSDRAQAIVLYRNGHTKSDIARTLGCSAQDVRQVLASAGDRALTSAACHSEPPPPARMSMRQARQLDRSHGWRPREGAPHPRGRADTYDRDRVLVVAEGDMYVIEHELWIYADDRWTLHARNRVAAGLDEPQMIEIRSSLQVLAAEREEARRYGAVEIRTPLSLRSVTDVDEQRQRQALIAALNA